MLTIFCLDGRKMKENVGANSVKIPLLDIADLGGVESLE
jgi:hypothetical protein